MKHIVAGLLAMFCASVLAEETDWYACDHLYVQAGSYIHFDPSDEHGGSHIFTALEAVRADQWLYGLALFDNSFGQFSQYLYAGRNWELDDSFTHFHAKMTFGFIHGYKDEYQDKIPMNELGVAPAIIPGIGYKKDRFGADVYLLGLSGLLFTVGYDI